MSIVANLIKRFRTRFRSLTGKRHDTPRLNSIPNSGPSSYRCVLHVGTDKTGSTAIQAILDSNPVQLEELGFFYAKSGRGPLHHHGDLQHQFEIGVKQEQEWKNFREEQILHEGLVGILSFEGFYHLSFECLTKIKKILQGIDIHVVIYLRRQSDKVRSGVAQRIKQGMQLPLEEYDRNRLIDMAQDYAPIISKFENVFGHNNISVRRYEKCRFKDGDLFVDFMSTVGADVTSKMLEDKFFIPHRDPNPSLDVEGIYILSELDRIYVSERVRRVVRDILLKNGANDKSTFINDDISTEIDRRYSKSNTVIARKWFGENNLFSSPPGFVYRQPREDVVKEYSELIWKIIPYVDMPVWGGGRQPVLQLRNSGRLKTISNFESCIPLRDTATEIIVRTHVRCDIELSLFFESKNEAEALVQVAGERLYVESYDDKLIITIPSHLFSYYAGLIQLSIWSECSSPKRSCIKEMSYVKDGEQ